MTERLSFPWLEPLFLGVMFSLSTYIVARKQGPVAAAIVSVLGYLIFGYRHRTLLQRLDALGRLAATDDLTGLPNDRSFRKEMLAKPFGLILFDIDHFKSFNDTYGHPAGDDALQELGSLSKSLADIVIYRLGGDEFGSLVFEADLAIIEDHAQTIRQAIRNHDWPLRPITASFGIATREAGTDPEELRVRADQALYNAKRNGGDGICIYRKP